MRKKQLVLKVSQCEMRIHELEEILCPCSQHDAVELKSEFVATTFAPIIDGYTKYTCQCKRCKKYFVRRG